MSSSPRGCPDATGRATWWSGRDDRRWFRVALIAGDHVDRSDQDVVGVLDDTDDPVAVIERQDPSATLERHALIVALATAVAERGGIVVVPANVALAHLVALATYPHAHPHAAEDRDPHGTSLDREPPPLHVVETGGFDPGARRLLAPFVDANVLTYAGPAADVEQDGVRGEDLGIDELLRSRRHHPFRRDLVEDCIGLLVLGPDRTMIDDLRVVTDTDVRTVVLGRRDLPPDLDRWAAASDPSRRLLGDDQGDDRSDDDQSADSVPGGADPGGVVAPGYVVERVIEEWLGRSGAGAAS